MPNKPSHTTAILLAIFVTFLWSTSWVLIKFGLSAELPAVTFAGLRYTLAFLFLSPWILFNPREREHLRKLTPRDWRRLATLGLFYYSLTQGAVFLSLAYLPAVMVNLLLNLTNILIAAAGIIFLREIPSRLQWIGVILTVIGVSVYFLPFSFPRDQVLGLLAALVCVVANAVASLLGRDVNRSGSISPLVITFVSMGIGSVILLVSGLATQGLGTLAWRDGAIITWLALINTAFAFTIWNRTLQTLSAVESSVINSLMMPQIAILAYLFLGEKLTVKEIIGLTLVGVGVMVVQLRKA